MFFGIVDFDFGVFSPMGVACLSLPPKFVEGTTISVGGNWLVLALFGFGLEKNLCNLKLFGGARVEP